MQDLISREQILQLFNDFTKLRTMIIGDVMVDAYLYGAVDRISPEAPVPVVSLKKRVNMLGGAANVALNIKALGAEPLLFSVIGSDHKGSEFLELLENEKISQAGIIQSADRITTAKFRIIGGKNQMLRVDEEITNDISTTSENLLLEKISQILLKDDIHMIIFQDYNKGVVTPRIIEEVEKLAAAKNIPIAVDPKKKNFNVFRNTRLFKPNLKELREGLHTDFPVSDREALEKSMALLQEQNKHEIIMVTLGDHGIATRFLKDGSYRFHIQKAHVRNISDVSGAGDTVISVAALCTALDCEPEASAFLANLAGGIVCEYVGVVPVNKQRLIDEVLS